MKTTLKNKQLITFFNWGSNFLRNPNGIDSAFKKSVQINMKTIEPLVEKYQQQVDFIHRDNATVEDGENGGLKKVPTGENGTMEFHYSKKNREKLVKEINQLAEENVEVDVASLSKETSIPKAFKKDYFTMRALSGIVVTKEMADSIMFEVNEDEPADKEEKVE